jgi:hypothetical protein
VWLQKKEPDFVCVVEKRNLVVRNMIASLGSKWLQKTKVCHCKNCCFISVTAKKEKEKLSQCVIATIWRAWLQPGVMCVAKKMKPDFVCLLAKLLVCLEYDCKPG